MLSALIATPRCFETAHEAMVSPAAEAFAESLSTLKFAQRAKGVVTTPQASHWSRETFFEDF